LFFLNLFLLIVIKITNLGQIIKNEYTDFRDLETLFLIGRVIFATKHSFHFTAEAIKKMDEITEDYADKVAENALKEPFIALVNFFGIFTLHFISVEKHTMLGLQ